MELPGGIEKDELGVALSYAIMLGGGAPSAPNGSAKSTPAVQPRAGHEGHTEREGSSCTSQLITYSS